MNQETGIVTSFDNKSKAQISVKPTHQRLLLTSKNPHSRISTEYRLYTRRETSFAKAVARADRVQ